MDVDSSNINDTNDKAIVTAAEQVARSTTLGSKEELDGVLRSKGAEVLMSRILTETDLAGRVILPEVGGYELVTGK